MKVYLDNAATTPLDPEVIKLMYNLMQNIFANPSSVHEHGRKAKIIVEECRKEIASMLNVVLKKDILKNAYSLMCTGHNK